MSHSVEKEIEQAPRTRHSSLKTPTSFNSVSLSARQAQSISFTVPSSSPARSNILKPVLHTSTTRAALKTKSSSSIIQPPSSSCSLGKRRLGAPQSAKNKETVNETTSAISAASISDFGAIKGRQVEEVAVPPPQVNMRSHFVRTMASPLKSPIRQPVLCARYTLRPSTATDRTNASEALSSKSLSFSNLPRARVGSSTSTRPSQAKLTVHGKVASASAVSSRVSLSPRKREAASPVITSTSVKSRAAAWGQCNESCPSPSPSTRVNGRTVASQVALPPLQPVRARRLSLVQQTSRILRPDPTRSRRASLIGVPRPTVAASRVAVVAQKDEFDAVKKVEPQDIDSGQCWSRWKAEMSSEAAVEAVKWRGKSDSKENIDPTDLVNVSMLLDEKMLDELDAEVGRLGLDVSFNNAEDETNVSKGKVQQQQEHLLQQLTQQRNAALVGEKRLQEQLEVAKKRISIMEAAEKLLHREEKSDFASQTERENDVTQSKVESDPLEEAENNARSALQTLALESIREEWKHATEMACNHLTLLETQSEMCTFLHTQLDIFQQIQ